ncbi:T9SS type A sorting domain-containing protein [bacterium]|nr:T9SS type A sorting domain-containing protein [bacterium]
MLKIVPRIVVLGVFAAFGMGALHVLPSRFDGEALMSTDRARKLERKAEQREASDAGSIGEVPHLDWYFLPRTWNADRSISAGLRQGSRHIMQQRHSNAFRKASIGNVWSFIGPNDIGGRIRVVKFHPTNPSIIYAGSASGGVFKSTDGGAHWTAMSDSLPTLSIGHMAIDRNNPEHIYIGTGEGSFNWDKVYGDGLYRSTDGGHNWVNLMLDEINEQDFAINHVELHPENSDYIYAAATFGGASGGLMRSTDGGESWTTVLNGYVRDVILDPSNPDRVYVAMGYRGGQSSNGLYVSEQKGNRWTFNKILDESFPPPDSTGNIVMDASLSQPGTLVAVMQRVPNVSPTERQDFYGVYVSTDYGVTWERTEGSDQSNMREILRSQGDYNLYVRFHPTDPNTIFIGGIHSWRSTDFGKTFTQITKQTGLSAAWVDMHYADFSPTDPDVMIVASDGGLFRTEDCRRSSPLFEEINVGLGTMQFYAMDFDRQDPTRVAGGTQDRRNNLGSATTGEWERLSWGGDGGYVAFDYEDSDVFYITSQYGNIARTTNGGQSFRSARSGLDRTDSNGNYLFSFVTPFIMHPTQPKTLFTGGNRMYRTTNGAQDWIPISDDLTGSRSSLSQFQDLSQCPTNPDVLYGVTGYSSTAWVSTNVMADTSEITWERIDDGLPNLFLADIEVHPTEPNIAYVGTAAFSAVTGVYKTTDYGQTWEFMKGETEETQLPEIPVGAITIWEKHPNVVYVGTDLGVFVSRDAGRNWYPFGEGLPNVVIDDLKITPDDILYAATHGRGMWRTSAIVSVDDEAQPPLSFSLGQNYPNPFNPTSVIPFTLDKASHVRVRLYTSDGKLLQTLLDEWRDAGTHQLRVDASGLRSGLYLYELTADNAKQTRKMVVLK